MNRTTAFGLLKRKEHWTLSLRGWVTIFVVGASLAAVGGLGLHPFLAVQAPVEADALVVEGWLSDAGLERAAKEFRTRSNTTLYVTGGPLAKGSYLIEFKTFADLGVATLREMGIDKKQLVAVPAPEAHGNRTLHSAIALQQYFAAHNLKPDAINVVTEGAHARRSRLLFQRALGDGIQVGVISTSDPDYDPDRWWAYSEGWRSVIGETVGYLYAKIGVRGS
jgi:hypothetical protein